MPNNRPIWIVIAVMVGAMLLLQIPGLSQPSLGEGEGVAAAVAKGPPEAQGLEGSPGEKWLGTVGRADDEARWLLERERQREADAREEKKIKLYIGGAISLIIAAFAAFIVLRTGSAADDRNWAFGIIGGVLGYWLGR